MKGKISLIPIAMLVALMVSGCADDKAASPASQDSTAVSIDTDEGSFSFKSDEGGDSTAVSVDTDGDKEGKGK